MACQVLLYPAFPQTECEGECLFYLLRQRLSLDWIPRLDKKSGKVLEARGVSVLLGTKVTSVERKADNSTLVVSISAGEAFDATQIVVAAGRRAWTDNCGLEIVKIPIDGSPMQVDDSLHVKDVAGHWLYAIGDVNGRSPFTHMCKYKARIALNAIIQRTKGETHKATSLPLDPTVAMADHCAVPQAVFTQPAVAHIGLTRTEAEKQGRSVRAIQAPSASLASVVYGSLYGQGWAQWVVESGESQRLLGMIVVGHDMSELIHAATVAIVGGFGLH